MSNLPVKKSKEMPPSVAETALIKEMTGQPPSVTRLARLSDYFLEQGYGPSRMLEAIKGMLKATASRYDYKKEAIVPMPDWKVREKGVWWLYKIHMDFVNDKTPDQIPAQFFQVINDFRAQARAMNPAELDEKYGVVE